MKNKDTYNNRFMQKLFQALFIFSGVFIQSTQAQSLPALFSVETDYIRSKITYARVSENAAVLQELKDLSDMNGNPVKLDLPGDVILKSQGRYLYVIVRRSFSDGENKIIKIDLTKKRVVYTMDSKQLGLYCNPQDIVFASNTKAFISFYGSLETCPTGLLKTFNPSSGQITAVSDLNLHADADRMAELSNMIIAGNKLFVQVLNLNANDRFQPSETASKIIRLDLDTLAYDLEKDVLELLTNEKSGNPVSKMMLNQGTFYVALVGSFSSNTDGKLVSFDAFAERLQLNDWQIEEELLGGNVVDLVNVSLTEPYAFALVKSSAQDRIVRIHLETQNMQKVLISDQAGALSSLTSFAQGNSHWVYFADQREVSRNQQGGVQAFLVNEDASIDQKIVFPSSLEEGRPLLPVYVTVVNLDVSTSVQSQSLGVAFQVYPNPANKGIIHIQAKFQRKPKKCHINIVNGLGQTLKNFKVKETIHQSYQGTLDTSALTSGMYIVQLICSTGHAAHQKVWINT